MAGRNFRKESVCVCVCVCVGAGGGRGVWVSVHTCVWGQAGDREFVSAKIILFPSQY